MIDADSFRKKYSVINPENYAYSYAIYSIFAVCNPFFLIDLFEGPVPLRIALLEGRSLFSLNTSVDLLNITPAKK